jgi:hypothetical protein
MELSLLPQSDSGGYYLRMRVIMWAVTALFVTASR